MEEINEHKMAGSSVPQTASVSFYEGIAQQCMDNARMIREEMGE